MDFLLDRGANPNAKQKEVCTFRVVDVEVDRYLHCSFAGQGGSLSPLMVAAAGSHIDCMALLLARGADIDHQDEVGAYYVECH